MTEQDAERTTSEEDPENADGGPAAGDDEEPDAPSGDEPDRAGGEASADGADGEADVAVDEVRDGEGDADIDEEIDADIDEEVDEALVERVAESDPEGIARELAALRARVEGLEGRLADREAEVEELTDQVKRKQAEFQNYKKRMEKRREQEKRRATEDLVERLLDVRDNLVRALDQEDADAEAIRGGVEATLSQFDRVLDDENVDVVSPEPGDEVDPHTHEVLMRVDSDQPADTVADVHRPGYVMADKVLQTAQVTVSDDESDGS